MTSKPKIHLEEKTHSRELVIHLVKALQVLMDSQASSIKEEEQPKGVSEIYSKNLRRCLVVKAEDSEDSKSKQKAKT